MMSDVINFKEYREKFKSAEDLVKERVGAEHVVIGAVMPDGSFHTFIPYEITDIDLVYLIQTLKDRRRERVDAINS